MNSISEEKIRQRAQEIWEQEGRPDGRAEEHWRQAAEELMREDEDGQGSQQKQDGGQGSQSPSGLSSTLQPGGTTPSGSQPIGGSFGTGGGSTAGSSTGNARKV